MKFDENENAEDMEQEASDTESTLNEEDFENQEDATDCSMDTTAASAEKKMTKAGTKLIEILCIKFVALIGRRNSRNYVSY